MTEIFQDKVLYYREVLKKSYWELREAGRLLCGVVSEDWYFNLSPDFYKDVGIDSFSLPPIFDQTQHKVKCSEFGNILNIIISSVQNDEIQSYPLKVNKISYTDDIAKKKPYFKEHTYLILPDDAIAASITQGVILPEPLQIAYGIRQLTKLKSTFSKGKINQVKRDAIAQALIWKYPDESISSLCRRYDRLRKGYKNFEFLHSSNYEYDKSGTGKRPRESFKRVMSVSTFDEIPLIPMVMKKQDKEVYFDFQRLKVILEVIAYLILVGNKDIDADQLLKHPLIAHYSWVGGPMVEKIVKFCLKSTLDILHIAENPLYN